MSQPKSAKSEDRLQRYARHHKRWRNGNALEQMRLEWELSPLGGGKHARKFAELNEAILQRETACSQFDLKRLPPFKNLSEENAITIGERVETGEPVHYPLQLFPRHILINAPTGRGKTAFQRVLARALLGHAIRQIHSDPKGDLRCLLRLFSDTTILLPLDQSRMNPLALAVGSPTAAQALLSDLARAYRIRPETMGRLIDVWQQQSQKTPQSWRQFLNTVEAASRHRNDHPLRGCVRTLRQHEHSLGRAADVVSGPSLLDLAEPIVVLDRTECDPRAMEADAGLLLNELLLRSRQDGYDGRLRRVLFFDEATFLFRKQSVERQQAGFPTIQERLLTQIRASGNGLIFATQQLGSVSPLLTTNCASFVCLGAASPDEAQQSAKLLGLPPERAMELCTLAPGEAFLRCPAYLGPVKFRFPFIPAGPVPSTQWVTARMNPRWDELDAQCIWATDEPLVAPTAETTPTDETPPEPPQPQVFDLWIALLKDVVTHPEASLTEHYKNLGWGASRGQRIKTRVLESGLVTAERETGVSRRPKELLRLTEAGHEFLRQQDKTPCDEPVSQTNTSHSKPTSAPASESRS